MYSCLVLYRSNQRSLVSSVLDLDLLPTIHLCSRKWLMQMGSTIPRTCRCYSCARVNAMLVIARRILSPLVLSIRTRSAALLAKLFSISFLSSLIFRERATNSACNDLPKLKTGLAISTASPWANIIPTLKPDNPGKCDSQIVLMAFLQKMISNKRMSTFEYKFREEKRNSWNVLRCIVYKLIPVDRVHSRIHPPEINSHRWQRFHAL